MSITNSKNFYEKLTKLNENHQTFSIWWSPVLLLSFVMFFVITLVVHNTLPKPILQKDESNYPHNFIGERAHIVNQNITNIGPKVVGSDLNEIEAVNYLRSQVLEIINDRNPIHNIELDVQVASGTFNTNPAIKVYQNVQNVVVKLSPADKEPTDSLLLSTHFDSVPISPGGGDSCTFTAVGMETLRVMSKSPFTFRHSVIFVFNGAEEDGLLGSHAFITQHKWAGSVRAYLNMDAAGTGGKDVLFQSTPGNTWMMGHYSKVAPHPMTTVMGEEMYQNTSFVPSTTDFTIYRDFGKIPGVDVALYKNAYVYHTKYDNAENVPMETMQNAGDNILALAKSIANSSELAESHWVSDKFVFYDFIGFFVVTYSMTAARIINYTISVLALVTIYFSMKYLKVEYDLKVFHITHEFGAILIAQIITIALVGGGLALLAMIFDYTRSMSWFSNNWMIFGLYYCPVMFILGMGPATYLRFKKRNGIHLSCYVQMFLHAQGIICVLAMVFLTSISVRSAFLLLIGLTFYTLTTFINLFSGLQNRNCGWISIHLIGQVIPFMFYTYYAIFVFELFIPIQGRSGPISHPDTFIALVAVGTGILLAGHLIPTLCMFRRPILLMCGFLVVFLIFVILMATPLGFPYKQVTPQRFWIFHTERQFYDFDHSLTNENSGYFLLPMDKNENKFVSKIIPEFATQVSSKSECESKVLCGCPLYTSGMIPKADKSTWIPSNKPAFPMKTTVELVSKEILDATITPTFRFKFRVTGPEHVNLFVTPRNGTEIIGWSFPMSLSESVSTFHSAPVYFISIAEGKGNMEYEFFIGVQKNDLSHPENIEVTAVGHYNHYDEYRTTEFNDFLESFPSWAHVTPWMCSYIRNIF